MRTSVLLSIKPKFAEAILKGMKTFEFRRIIPRSGGVRTVVLYASSPVKMVVGEFVVGEVLTMSPGALWRVTKVGSGINRQFFRAYFGARKTAHALRVTRVRRYVKPLELEAHFGLRRPPQSFCYL